MWIYTQIGDILIKVDNFKILYENYRWYITSVIEGNIEKLGQYDNLSKAEIVLYQICTAISHNINYYSMPSNREVLEDE